ncbi:MAG: putative membrane protein YkoI [Flavobacteriales bacterium]|jgi:uncharacterized membrane protein YkoI
MNLKSLKNLSLIILSSLCLPILLLSPAHAEISKSQAAKQAKAKYGGKVLNVAQQPSKEAGVSVYKVKLLLSGGRVKTVIIRG